MNVYIVVSVHSLRLRCKLDGVLSHLLEDMACQSLLSSTDYEQCFNSAKNNTPRFSGPVVQAIRLIGPRSIRAACFVADLM